VSGSRPCMLESGQHARSTRSPGVCRRIAQAAAVARIADAVVVGSAIVRRIGEGAARQDLSREISRFVQPMVQAVHSARSEPAHP
jgi:hypothetical protein